MGKLYNDLVLENYQKVKDGKILAVPWNLERVNAIIPGWVKESYTIITGNTGSAKTKFTKFLLFEAIKLANENKLKVKIKWYALEESPEHFQLSLISAYLASKYNIKYSTAELQSYKGNIEEKHLKLIEELDDYVTNNIMPNLEVISHIRNPTGIYKDVREYMETIGENVIEDGKIVGYKYNDEDYRVFVVIDHATFLNAEKINGTHSQWESLKHLSQEYLSHQMKDRFKCIVVLIQQQASETERQEFYKGETVVSKLEPSLTGLGIYKNTQQDATMVIGLFSPSRYNIKEYYGYDISALGDKCRFAIILKDRYFGNHDVRIPLLFNGATNQFKTLPTPESEDIKIIYEHYKQLNQ